ncbi:MAG: hypothetical protein CVU57_06355 [Deltaproteobacteria bacterium HGW-Deltaproteobacteria-15]|jgi:hypothetical protein|nr:MAG: hypothetical protein CVU57_06355 [Deltaproteobacteria bacterium HGW-Deltaproteobacteria-15]
MADDFFDDFGWEDMALIGSLSETLSEEELERRRLEKEMEPEAEECEYCCQEREPCDPPEEPFIPPDEDPYP